MSALMRPSGAMLKRLVDELIGVRLTPFVAFFGQPEVQDHPDALLKVGMGDIVDRFYTRWHRLRSIRLTELASTFRMYDRPLPGRAVSFSQEFAAPLVAAGWSLASDAEAFSRQFEALNKELLAPYPDEVPTKFVVAAVRRYLIQLQGAGEAARPNLDWIKECVRESGLVDSMRELEEGAPKRKRPRAKA